ncbi:hypothetical protein ACQR0Z_31595 [Bradyrhizobium sp. HKCCYLS3077]|uniref:hypothetical protein n=1 Tax=unclassified Bradyrhizobium TaxID=2631580 RepID=UPI003EB9BBE8
MRWSCLEQAASSIPARVSLRANSSVEARHFTPLCGIDGQDAAQLKANVDLKVTL